MELASVHPETTIMLNYLTKSTIFPLHFARLSGILLALTFGFIW
jgi:hypothetical protein